MNTSQCIDLLATDLAAAQGEFPPITRNREVTVKSEKGSYKFEYATLDHILELTKPARTKYGLALAWGCRTEQGVTTVYGRLLHKSGQWIESSLPLSAADFVKPQAMGSGLTYRKRYIADQLLGLSAAEDDDAAGEAGHDASFNDRNKRHAPANVDFPPPDGSPIGRSTAAQDAPKAPAPAATTTKAAVDPEAAEKATKGAELGMALAATLEELEAYGAEFKANAAGASKEQRNRVAVAYLDAKGKLTKAGAK